MEKEVINEIKRICGEIQLIEHIGCFFKLDDLFCMYMDNKEPCLMKFAIPCLYTVSKNKSTHVIYILNQMNRKLKYVKSFILNNGCITIVYERRIMEGESPGRIVNHIVSTLRLASKYIRQRIENI